MPEFAMEDLPLGGIAALVPEFAVKDLPMRRTLMMMMYITFEMTLVYVRQIFVKKFPNKY